jgi:lipopolysaccharide transport system permease protein
MQFGFGSGLRPWWAVVWRHRQIILRMIRREVVGRYLGSLLGVAWSAIQPLALICVFSFAFNVVFQSRWTGAAGAARETNFAVAMFFGYIIFNLVAEPLGRAPSLILSHATYVKKTVFPLEILAAVTIGTALFHFSIAFLVWSALLLVIHQSVPWTILLLPLVLFPLVPAVLGIVWLFASLGVFVRDLGQVVGPITMSLMFLSPIFYPTSAVPSPFRAWMYANPLTCIIEDARKVAIFGELPSATLLAANLLLGLAVAHLGYLWFARTRRGFADVL